MRQTILQPGSARKIKEQVKQDVADQIRMAISESDLTLLEIANKAFVPPSVLSRAASGKHNLTVETLGLICHGLGIEVNLG